MSSDPEQTPSDSMIAEPALRRSSAFLASLALHTLAMLAGAMLVRGGVSLTPAAGESDRRVAIALYENSPQANVKYFSERSAAGDSASPQAAKQAGGAAAIAALPSADDMPAELKAAVAPGFAAPAGDAATLDPQAGRGGAKNVRVIEIGEELQAELAEEARGAKGTAPTGPAGEVSLFGSTGAVGRSFVFIIDRSASMGTEGIGAIDDAQRELARALAELLPQHTFQVAAYNQGPVYFNGRRLQNVTPENRKKCDDFLNDLAAFGATDHTLAILSALQLRPDVLFVLTDGGDPYVSEVQAARIRREAGGTAIHTIQFGFGPPDDEESVRSMKRLAAAHRGDYRYVDLSKQK